MSYFGATVTPVLDFWWCLIRFSKSEWVLPYLLLWRQMLCTFPEIHLWCYMLLTSWQTALWGIDQVHILPKDITVWQQWVSNPRSTDHESCALKLRPSVLVKKNPTNFLLMTGDFYWYVEWNVPMNPLSSQHNVHKVVDFQKPGGIKMADG